MGMEKHHNMPLTVIMDEDSSAGLRLDKFLSLRLPEFSRTRIQSLLEAGCISGDKGAIIRNSALKVKCGDKFSIMIPEVEASEIKPVAMELDIVYEDEDILIINKPAGLTVHPAPGHAEDTLVNALLAHCGEGLSGIGGVARPGIVHRIDKDTSGLLAVAKHDKAHAHLARQLKNRTLKRIYQAITWGVPTYAEGTIEGNIGRSPHDRKKMALLKTGGKPATTHYQVLESFYFTRPTPGKRNMMQRDPVAALVECELETGRTHQIRVHFASHHYPLVGDPVYGSGTQSRLKSGIAKALPEDTLKTLQQFNRQALHAKELALVHPITKEEMTFEAPMPDDFFMLLEALRTLQ